MQAKPALGEAATTINGETVHHLTDQHWRRISSLGEPRLPGSCRLLPGHQIEIFDILPVKFDGKAFESYDFHLHSAVEAGKFSGEIQPDFSKIAYS